MIKKKSTQVTPRIPGWAASQSGNTAAQPVPEDQFQDLLNLGGPHSAWYSRQIFGLLLFPLPTSIR